MVTIRMRRGIQGLLAALIVATAWAVVAGGHPRLVDVQVIAFNDFHGNLEPPTGSNGRIGQTVSGGVEFMATHIASLRAENPNTIVVSAGDNIGATPLISGLFHDEPSIEALNALGLQVSAVGNHELDEGWWELLRMANGGCHPTDGCQGRSSFAGARFEFLAANVTLDAGRAPADKLVASRWKPSKGQPPTLFPPSTIKVVGGVKVGFIGLTLEGAPKIVSPAALTGLAFYPEAAAANEQARALRRKGASAVVVLIHEGGDPTGRDPNGCEGMTGPIVDIVAAMSADIDVVVSGHTHRSYICMMGTTLVTSAESYSRLVTDIDLQVDPKTRRVVAKHARNVITSRDVPPASVETQLIAHYRPMADKVGARQVGSVLATVDRAGDESRETALGEMVADAMLEASAGVAKGGAQVALVNIGGVRADLTRPAGAAPGTPTPVTFSDVFNVLPFGNITIVKTMTGDALARLLNEQFDQRQGRWEMLQVSKGFSYAFDSTKSDGQRVDRSSLTIDGKPVAMTDTVRVAAVDFVWTGGDRFTVVKEGTDPTTVGDVLDEFIDYLGRHSPVSPGSRGRVHRVR